MRGNATPDGMQHPLHRAKWDADTVRDDVRAYVGSRQKTVAARMPRRAWQRLSAGAGAKGQRYYDRAQIDIHDPAGRPGHPYLLVRRKCLPSGQAPLRRRADLRPAPPVQTPGRALGTTP